MTASMYRIVASQPRPTIVARLANGPLKVV
jgi:hypothetical protein